MTGVHDSYWTHACDVDEMNKILREKFVELYEAPILENVSTFPSFNNPEMLSYNVYYILAFLPFCFSQFYVCCMNKWC